MCVSAAPGGDGSRTGGCESPTGLEVRWAAWLSLNLDLSGTGRCRIAIGDLKCKWGGCYMRGSCSSRQFQMPTSPKTQVVSRPRTGPCPASASASLGNGRVILVIFTPNHSRPFLFLRKSRSLVHLDIPSPYSSPVHPRKGNSKDTSKPKIPKAPSHVHRDPY